MSSLTLLPATRRSHALLLWWAAFVLAARWYAPALLAIAEARPDGPASARPSRLRALMPVILAAVVGVAVVAIAGVVALGPLFREPAEPPRAADGTPRLALALSGDRLVVVDLSGRTLPTAVPAPEAPFTQFTAIARDARPGRYLAAVTTPGDGGYGGRVSRVYRVGLNGYDGARLGEQVGGDLGGMVTDLAVSPAGRVAYSRVVPASDSTGSIGTTYVGVTGPADGREGGPVREWSAPGAHGSARDAALGLHWRDADTLVFHARSPRARTPRLASLDTSRPGTALLPGDTVRVLNALTDGPALTAPGTGTGTGRMVLAEAGPGPGPWSRILLLEPPAKPPVGVAFTEPRGGVTAFTLDPSGRYLLVAVRSAQGMTLGGVPGCGSGGSSELVRVDLRPPPGPRSPFPDLSTSGVPSLGLPSACLWQGDGPLTGLAW
ncbi:hypothetical protein [Nonomuraea sp. NPDC005501]|uniref:hypothetical protein n=1 Tax=Nonomuraea sp. NPDC005501 TaxID=3156884 RepID=UPI00339ECB16